MDAVTPSGRQRDPDAARRTELGRFLRSRREGLVPEQVGLPTTPRRRTRGLRREEVAALAGVSITWFAALEQGRDIRPSTEVLTAVAGALRLDDAERVQLQRLSAVSLREPAPPSARSAASPELVGVLAVLDAVPAFVSDHVEDLLAWTPPFAALLPGLVDAPEPNLARWALLDPDARGALVDWLPLARRVVARIRTAVGRFPDDPRLQRLADDLLRSSAEAATWWAGYDLADERRGAKGSEGDHHPGGPPDLLALHRAHRRRRDRSDAGRVPAAAGGGTAHVTALCLPDQAGRAAVSCIRT